MLPVCSPWGLRLLDITNVADSESESEEEAYDSTDLVPKDPYEEKLIDSQDALVCSDDTLVIPLAKQAQSSD